VLDSTVQDAVTVAKMTAPTNARAPIVDALLLDGGVLDTAKTEDRGRGYSVGSMATAFVDTVLLRWQAPQRRGKTCHRGVVGVLPLSLPVTSFPSLLRGSHARDFWQQQ
jgi:hypothetical protein